jgi:hypothetical protein
MLREKTSPVLLKDGNLLNSLKRLQRQGVVSPLCAHSQNGRLIVFSSQRFFFNTGTRREHEQGKAVANLTGPVTLRKIADSSPVPWPRLTRPLHKPLQGIRVLDLTRVIAGPVAGRTLAGNGAHLATLALHLLIDLLSAYGADVLWGKRDFLFLLPGLSKLKSIYKVTAPHLPSLPYLDPDTSRGKRSIHLDLRHSNPADRDKFVALLRSADVLLQSYRPGALAALGFSPEEVAKINPSVVYATLSAWGREGPWEGRRGFDSLAQTATGFNVDEGSAYEAFMGSRMSGMEKPRALPCQALDHASGYLLAYVPIAFSYDFLFEQWREMFRLGIQTALLRRASSGGCWQVIVSLAETGKWIRELGRSNTSAFERATPSFEDVREAGLLDKLVTRDGRNLTFLSHSATLEDCEVGWTEAPRKLGTDKAEWLPL